MWHYAGLILCVSASATRKCKVLRGAGDGNNYSSKLDLAGYVLLPAADQYDVVVDFDAAGNDESIVAVSNILLLTLPRPHNALNVLLLQLVMSWKPRRSQWICPRFAGADLNEMVQRPP